MIKSYLHELNITGSQIDEKNVQKIIDLIEKTILKKKQYLFVEMEDLLLLPRIHCVIGLKDFIL